MLCTGQTESQGALPALWVLLLQQGVGGVGRSQVKTLQSQALPPQAAALGTHLLVLHCPCAPWLGSSWVPSPHTGQGACQQTGLRPLKTLPKYHSRSDGPTSPKLRAPFLTSAPVLTLRLHSAV